MRKEAANGDITYYVDGVYSLFVPANGSAPEHRYFVSNGQRVVTRVEWRTDAQNADVTEYLHDDYLGSTELITSAAGTARKRISYEAFGAVRHTDWMSPESLDEYSDTGFTGHRHEEDTLAGVIDMGARMYDPILARFLQPDPMTGSLGYSQDLDRYSYAFNRPLTIVDPTGLDEERLGATGRIPKSDQSRPVIGGFAPVTFSVSNGVYGNGYRAPEGARAVHVYGYISEPASTTDSSIAIRVGGSQGAAPEDPLQRRSGGGGGSSIQEMARAAEAFARLMEDVLMPAADWMESNRVGDRVAGFGDSLSFGLTSAVRSWAGTGDAVDKSSAAYGNGEMAGVIFSLGFGVTHIGRNLAAQGWKVGRIGWDPRSWGRVRTVWSRATGGLKNKGQHLHHWLFPQRSKGAIHQGLINAGFNYLPISARRNSWMNGSTAARIAVEWGLKGIVLGIYGAPATVAINGE